MAAPHRRQPPNLGYVRGLCSSGKKSFFNRRGARALARKLKAEGDRAVRPYYCDKCEHWHVGHLPTAIRRGALTGAEWRSAR